jgi:ribosomal protein L31
MKKGIHPIKYNINFVTSINNSYILPFLFNITKLKMDIDPYTHIIYNKLLNINTIKQENKYNRIRLFSINK